MMYAKAFDEGWMGRLRMELAPKGKHSAQFLRGWWAGWWAAYTGQYNGDLP